MERTRLKRLLLPAMVALLVATAGCSALPGGDSEAAGYDVAGSELDGQTITDTTTEAVEDAGSFTIETSSTVTTSQGGAEQTGLSTIQVDLDDDRGIRNQTQSYSTENQTQEQISVVYTDGSTSYRKQTVQGETTYDQQEGPQQSFTGIRPVNTTAFTQNYTSIVDGFSWEQDGSGEVDGVAVTEYSLTGEPDKDVLNLPENATVEDASGALYIDSDGVLRQADIAYTVTTERGTTSIDATTTLTDVGSTSVEEPGWLSEVA
jgi:hypothetical protein